jgi:hypothetical protein
MHIKFWPKNLYGIEHLGDTGVRLEDLNLKKNIVGCKID